MQGCSLSPLFSSHPYFKNPMDLEKEGKHLETFVFPQEKVLIFFLRKMFISRRETFCPTLSQAQTFLKLQPFSPRKRKFLLLNLVQNNINAAAVHATTFQQYGRRSPISPLFKKKGW